MLLVFSSFLVNAAAPSIQAPRLSHLDTNTGLDQDTIEDILVDKEGFVWIATGEGLNRFDGVKVLKIHGKNNQLSANTVYTIFEHSSGQLLLSTGNSGIVALDRVSHEISPILVQPHELTSEWKQYSHSMVEMNNGDMLIALAESIYRYSWNSKTASLVYKLSRQQIEAGNTIRTVFAFNQYLLFGTHNGLFAIDSETNKLHTIMEQNIEYPDRSHIKLLKSFEPDTLYVGAVSGLYKFSLGELTNFIKHNWEKPAYKVVADKRNIWDMVESKSGLIYVSTDIGLYQLNSELDNIEYLFRPSKNYEILSQQDITTLSFDNSDNLWLGTITSGAMIWSPLSLLFENVYNSVFSTNNKLLSDNAVLSIYQYDANTLFLGTRNGLNKYNLSTGDVEQFYTSESLTVDYSESEITEIYSIERGFLWLNTTGGIRYFNIESGRYEAFPFSSQEVLDILNEWSYSIAFGNNNSLWTVTESGVYVIDITSEKTTKVDNEKYALNTVDVSHFIGLDNATNSILLAAHSELWGISLEDYSFTLLHSIKGQSSNPFIFPDKFVRQGENIAWLSYPGEGLFKLNGDTLNTLAKYSTQNMLSTKLIYDLKADNDGELWFSSHSGIHAFNPDTMTATRFGFLNGLASSEFNQGASERLSDGRFVFGANLGFTLFHPSELKQTEQNTNKRANITEVTLSSRTLNLPLTSLNGASIELEHDDAGLTIHYSALSFDQEANKRFHYRIISNGEVISYPSLRVSEITMATLAPGSHTIEIFHPGFDSPQNNARLTLQVAYPPFTSPLAYLLYSFLALVFVFFMYVRRKRMQVVLQEANNQVKLYNKRLTEALVASNSNIWEWHSSTNKYRAQRIVSDIICSPSTDKASQISPQHESECLHFDEYISYIHEDDRQEYLSKWHAFINQEKDKLDISYRVQSLLGKVLWYRDVGSLNRTLNGALEVKGTYTNLTESVASQEKSKLFGNAFKNTRDWVLIFDSNYRLIASNPAFMEAFNVEKGVRIEDKKLPNEHQEILHRTIKKLATMKPGQRWKTEVNIELGSKKINLLSDIYAAPDEKTPEIIDYFLIIATDITQQIRAQKELQKLANYDVLTGLINRTLLLERLKQSIVFSKRHNNMLAVLFIDLDGFKPINDSFGHIAGDSVLTEISKRLSELFREQDSVARIGGDEFVVLIEEVHDIHDINAIVSQVLSSVQQTISIGNQNVSVSASIGISMYPHDAIDAEHLLTNADIAMYSAKQLGKNRYMHYTAQMNEKVQSHTILQNRIKVAVAQKEFINFYQAIIDTHNGKSAGFELLLRWSNNKEELSPAIFIPIIEQLDCIIDVTMNAIEVAITDLANWYQQGFEGYVAVNLSAKQFAHRPDFETILNWLKKHNLPPSCLRFEITEGVLVKNNSDTINYMLEMRELGFKIALDDFGTGYSSLKYIKDFPLDILKIDRSFVQDVTSDKGTESIVQSTLMMTQLLGLDTVAEGVETFEQLQYFANKGCRYIQGFYFTKPQAFELISEMLHKNWLQNQHLNAGKVVQLQRSRKEKKD